MEMREFEKMTGFYPTAELYKCIEAAYAKLSANLEREQEWKAYTDTDRVDQLDYTRLQTSSGTKMLTDEDAKDLLYDWYGFAKEKVEILKNVNLYEISRHCELRVIGELDRHPLYNSTDWHYISFKCGCVCYELYNDNLNQVSM